MYPCPTADCLNLDPVPICVRPKADPFACAQPAYLIGFCDTVQKHRLEYPLGTALAGAYDDWVQLPSTECKCQPLPVKITDKATAIGKDCAGADLPPAPIIGAVKTIPDPDAVQKTALCTNQQLADILTELQKPRYDIETQTCNDGTDDWLLVIDKNELVAGLPTLSYTNLATGATQTTRPANLQCASPEEIEVVGIKGCLNGVTINGFSAIKDRATPTAAPVWTLWQDPITGALGAAPAGMVIGECAVIPEPKRRKICANMMVNGVPELVTVQQEITTLADGSTITKYIDLDSENLDDVTSAFISFSSDGCCPCSIDGTIGDKVKGGSLGIVAGTVRSATPAFTGAPDTVDTSALGATLQSITVSARGITDGVTTPNQVFVDCPDGTVFTFFDEQPFTWSVIQDSNKELVQTYRIRATGNAYANIGYTFL